MRSRLNETWFHSRHRRNRRRPVGGRPVRQARRTRRGGTHHPTITETFTVVRGRVELMLNERQTIAEPGASITVAPGVVHDWWNAGSGEAQVTGEIAPAARFEAAIRNTFGLAQDGKTDSKGIPSLLQLALFAREFDDVTKITQPPLVFSPLTAPSTLPHPDDDAVSRNERIPYAPAMRMRAALTASSCKSGGHIIP